MALTLKVKVLPCEDFVHIYVCSFLIYIRELGKLSLDGSVNPVNSLRSEAHEEISHHSRKSRETKETVKTPTEDQDDATSVTDLKITSLVKRVEK